MLRTERLEDDDEQQLTRTIEEYSAPKRASTLQMISWVLIAVLVFAFFAALLAVFAYIVFYNVQNPPKPPIHNPETFNKTVILMSIDGFRQDYLERYKDNCPTIRSLIAKGVSGSLKPIFPVKTFPNHYSIVTGLYAESHGIVNNVFYDKATKETFSISDEESMKKSKWWLGEPIWVTAKKAKVVSATYFWPGSDVEIQGILPDHHYTYNSQVSYTARIETLLGLFDKAQYGVAIPQLLITYFEGVDSAGHNNGPESEEVSTAIKKVDDAVLLLLKGLESRNINGSVDIVIVSDHGMSATDSTKTVLVSSLLGKDIVDNNNVVNSNQGPIFDLYIKDTAQIDVIYNQLVNAANASRDAIQGIYRKQDMPSRFHYSHSDRIADITIVANPPYSILRNDKSTVIKGAHGYDNELVDSQGIFVFSGKHFKSGVKANAPLDNINIYPLLCSLLDLHPAANNGTLETTVNYLK
ncbi:hypothetical protein ABK040_008588 [Willaertia magna]